MQTMSEQQHEQDQFNTAERRKRTRRILIAHLLIVAAFFAASFIWGKFS